MNARGHGHGKVILLGEHAVVYGHPALAGAIDLGVTVEARAGRLSLRVPAWNVDVDAEDDHPIACALRTIGDAIAATAAPRRAVTADDTAAGDGFLDRLPVALTGDATVPAAAGLGSSAALVVAITRAIAAASRVTLADREFADIANAAEAHFHQRPSGVDVALATGGGLGVFVRGRGLTAIAAPPLRVVVGFSGEPRRTAAMVAHVAACTGGRADDERLVALGAAATAGVAALLAGDLAALGALLDHAHATLATLEVSTPTLDAMAAAARSAGALGAKLTGAGGGGAVIALAPGREADVLAAWHASGHAGRIITVGATAP